MTEKFEIVAEYTDCVLLKKKVSNTCSYKYMIRDNEGDIIRMVVTSEPKPPQDFLKTAEEYSLEEIRRIKVQEEQKWRKEFVKA